MMWVLFELSQKIVIAYTIQRWVKYCLRDTIPLPIVELRLMKYMALTFRCEKADGALGNYIAYSVKTVF